MAAPCRPVLPAREALRSPRREAPRSGHAAYSIVSIKSDESFVRLAVTRSRRHIDWAYVGLWSITGLVAAFLIAPIAIIFLTSVTETKGFSFVWYERFVDTLREEPGTRPALARSIWFSTNLGLLVAACSTLGGVLGALALHKFVFRGKEVFQNLFLLPLTFPALIVGVGLLLVFSELRLFDRFTRLMIGHVVFALPYVVICVGASLRVYEEEVEEAARSLGANAAQVFWHITLPLIRPGIFAGAVFAFVSSFTNFPVSFFLSLGSAKPIPIWIYEFIVNGHNPLLAAISVVLVLLTVVLIVFLERAFGFRRILGTQA